MIGTAICEKYGMNGKDGMFGMNGKTWDVFEVQKYVLNGP